MPHMSNISWALFFIFNLTLLFFILIKMKNNSVSALKLKGNKSSVMKQMTQKW